jgi:hypothetical protein
MWVLSFGLKLNISLLKIIKIPIKPNNAAIQVLAEALTL